MKRAIVMVWILALVAAPAFAQKKKDKDKRGFVWDDRPTIVFGKNINVEFKGRALVEWRAFDPDQGEDLFHLRTARLGLKGKLTKHLSWEAEREVTGDDVTHLQAGDWKDVNAEWKTFDAIRVRGGRFKVPFGLEQTNGISELDFVYQSLGSAEIAPGRDRGGMVFLVGVRAPIPNPARRSGHAGRPLFSLKATWTARSRRPGAYPGLLGHS